MNKSTKEPLVIVDIGALGGVDKKWNKFEHQAVLFEPNPNAVFQPKNNWLVINSALSDLTGQRKLYITKRSSKSSFHRPNFSLLNKFPNPGRFEVVKTEDVIVDTLDNQLSINGVTDVDFIKVDVQGHELSVLRGASKSLEKALAVEVEVEFIQIYEGQALFSEVDNYLRERGFELVKFLNLETWPYANQECLAWADALYFKKAENLNEAKGEKLRLLKKTLMTKSKISFFRTGKRVIYKTKQFVKKILIWLGLYN